ncbi:hypothetical protein NVP1101O_067 [Vibrio phage 1.101.O._10N.261.45.C6]|nr:hypothetical protein NVP1101O_067 [Vibrio phage 1.101.O._10N.261.45.C6]
MSKITKLTKQEFLELKGDNFWVKTENHDAEKYYFNTLYSCDKFDFKLRAVTSPDSKGWVECTWTKEED